MKIAIDGRGINWYHGTGIGTYTENLLKNLINIDNKNYYHIYWSGKNYDEYVKENTKIIMTSKKEHRYFQLSYFPENLSYKNIDIYHVPQNGIGLFPSISCKKIVTIHDLIPYIMPETVGKSYLLKFLKEMPSIIVNSDAILTVSEYSKKDILKFFPVDKNKIFVTPLAANSNFKPLDKEKCKYYIKQKYDIDAPFILYLGGFSNRKNIGFLINAFSKVYKDLNKEYKLIILGSYKDNSCKLIKLVDKLCMSKNIVFTGFIEDNELPIFYNAAETFVYPSLYEGFGLPPLESMSCGTPVIGSNITSIPEVIGNAGILINPYDMSSLITALGNLLNNETLRTELSKKGYERSKNFSWEKTSRKTLEIYTKICTQTQT